MHRRYRTRGQRHGFHTRKRQEAGDRWRRDRVRLTVRPIGFAASAHFSFEQDQHGVGRSVLLSKGFTRLDPALLGAANEPFEVFGGEFCECRYPAQISDQRFGAGLVRLFTHAWFASSEFSNANVCRKTVTAPWPDIDA